VRVLGPLVRAGDVSMTRISRWAHNALGLVVVAASLTAMVVVGVVRRMRGRR